MSMLDQAHMCLPIESVTGADAAPTQTPSSKAVALLNEEEQRRMYLFPRVPFPLAHLNSLQATYLDQVVAWGWYVLGDDGLYAPTDAFLARFHATHQARVQQSLAEETARKRED